MLILNWAEFCKFNHSLYKIWVKEILLHEDLCIILLKNEEVQIIAWK